MIDAPPTPVLAQDDAVVSPPVPPPSIEPTPFTIVVDTREQHGYTFARPFAGLRGKQYAVQTVVCGLPSGDYSLVGFESRVAVERKSLADWYSTLGSGRARFVRELERLASYDFAAVVIEAEWSEILGRPPRRSRLNPKTVICSVIAFQQRFPRVHWLTVPGREMGEAVTLRILDRYWRDNDQGGAQRAKGNVQQALGIGGQE